MALTAKQEAFALAVVSGMSQADAYRSAYKPKPMTENALGVRAHEVGTNSNVVVRIAELRAPVVARVQYGLEQAMREAQEAFEVSRAKDNGGAMVAAATLRAKLNGLLIDRKEVRTGPLDGMDVDTMLSMQETIDAIRRARAPKESA